jgi:glycosyltransferase involved in cell wall biosynthesis
MRILFTQETDWLERNPAQQHHLAEMLSLRGHEIRAIDYEILWRTKGKRGLYSRRKIFNNVSKIHNGAGVSVIRPSIIKLPLLDHISLLFSHQNEIRRQINEFKPDLIVGWSILNSYLAMRQAKSNGIPFIYYWIDVLERLIPFKPFKIIGKLVERQTLKRSDMILAINDKLRDYTIQLGASAEQTRVVRAGIDTTQFNPDNNSRAVRKQYGLNEKDTVLFFMGWLYHFSGLREVTHQFAKVNNGSLKLLIVGDGDDYEELQELRQKYNLQDRIILTGKKTYQEIPGLISTADVCLLPAYPWEPIMQDIVPIKMYEYMAMKKPVVATSLPGIMKEFGEDNGVVYVDRPEDAVAMAIELVQNGSAETLGSKARNFAVRHSWDTITDEFEGILKEVIVEKNR